MSHRVDCDASHYLRSAFIIPRALLVYGRARDTQTLGGQIAGHRRVSLIAGAVSSYGDGLLMFLCDSHVFFSGAALAT